MTADITQISDEQLKQMAQSQSSTETSGDISKLSDNDLMALAGKKMTGQPAFDMAGANKNVYEAQANAEHPISTAIAKTAGEFTHDVGTAGEHFVNQFFANAPRSIANTNNTPIDFDAETEPGNIAAHAAGIAGAVMSPLNKLALMKATTIPGRMAAGAVAGAAYSPNNNFGDVGQRAVQAGAGAIASPMLGSIVDKASEMFAPTAEKISNTIQDLYNKAVKPTIVKGNATMLANANSNVETGVKSIIQNKGNLNYESGNQGLPKTLGETAEAIEQTKNDVFNKYNAMQQSATGKGVTINGMDLAHQLMPIIDDKATGIVSPSTQKYASDLFERLQNAGDMTPEQLQNVIKGFNGRLKAFYRNPSPDQYGNTAVDALIANNARKALDDAISGVQGAGYQDLKNQYGALSSMEKDISRASQRASNYQAKGLLDFTDIFTGEDIVKGLIGGNPADLLGGVAGRAAKEYYKHMNSPDANISRMFQKVDGYMSGSNIWKNAFTKSVQNSMQQKYSSVMQALSPQNNLALAANVKGTSGTQGAGNLISDNLKGMTTDGVSEANPIITQRPAENDSVESDKMIGEGSPATNYVAGKEGQTNIQNLHQQYESQRTTPKDDLNYPSKIAAGVAVGAGTVAADKAQASPPVNDDNILKAVLGEQEGGLTGQRAVASAIRNRGTLQGAYGANAIIEKDGNFYRKGTNGKPDRLISKSSVMTARQAVQDSKSKDFSGGANHWFSDADLKQPAVRRMLGRMSSIGRFGDNNFYKEKGKV